MLHHRHHSAIWVAIALCALIFSSCKKFEGDTTIPAYLHLDAISVVAQSANAPSIEAGFYTSLIDAVELIYYVEGDTAETVLGVYQLPCTVPVLRQGVLKYLRIVPVIKQNGVAGSRIQYPFYQTLLLNDVVLASADTTFLGTKTANTSTLSPADSIYSLTTHYYDKGAFDILCEDYFEASSFSHNFDTANVIWEKDDPQNACTGQGYARIHVPADKEYVAFSIPKEFSPKSSQYLYLEMDYWTDTELDLFMTGFEVVGSTSSSKSVMTLYANQGWQKIYINLGKVWSQFNYNTPIAIFFQAMNTAGIEGDVRLDNVKLIAL